MIAQRKSRRSGLTLSELLVVLSIISVMAVVAIPTFARLGVFSRNELNNTARTVHSMLKAARIYASTYRVNTAVVYTMDNWVDPNNPLASAAIPAPVMDSVTGEMVRVLRAAALVYALPKTPFGKEYPTEVTAGDYVFMSPMDAFREEFPGGMTIPLLELQGEDALSVVPAGNISYPIGDMPALGLRRIRVWLRGGPYNAAEYQDSDAWAYMPAHVFKPTGELDTISARERHVLLVAPSPDASPDVRLVNPEGGRSLSNLMHIPIELFRATGRVRIGS